jgi:hypothetical protein
MPGPSPLNIVEQQIGATCYLYGIGNDGNTVTIGPLDQFEFDSDDLTSTWKEKENADTTGNVQNIVQTNFKYERSLKLFISGPTRAAAVLVVGEILTALKLTIAHYKVPAFNGVWRVKPGTKINLKMDDNATAEIPIEQYLNAGQNTALTSAPIVG